MLDLNDPQDARTYVCYRVKRGNVRLGDAATEARMEDGSDQEFLRVARELFLHCCERDSSPPPLKPIEYH